MQTIVRTTGPLLFASIIAALAACSDESQPTLPSQGPAGPVAQQQDPKLEWLKQTDGISPGHWLANREAGQTLDPYDDRVGEMQQILDGAALRFRDHTRMIANRAVQLESMLREKRIDERAPRLIVTLSQVPGRQRYVESFAALTQQYYNLRVGGLSRGEATAALRRQVAQGQ